MKKSTLITLTLAVGIFLGYTVNASANHITSSDISASCINNGTGYSIEYNVSASLHAWRELNTLEFELTINSDFDTYVVTGSFTAIKPPDTYDFNGSITTTIEVDECDTYTITGSVTLIPENDTDTLGPITVICECGTTGCPRTPGYWKNHLDEWPVNELLIGGTLYDQADLVDMLRPKFRGKIFKILFKHLFALKPIKKFITKKRNIDKILIKHLIAAKLNVLSGAADPTILDTIAEADDYLNVGITDREIAEQIKDALDLFNNSGDCD